jgi:hypothetical protein
MESGAGDFSFDWELVQTQVARFTRVCSYDRAGYAWSDPGPTPRTRLWAKSQPHYNPARFSEFDFLPEELDSLYSEKEKSKNPLGAMPLIVLTSTVSKYGSADEQTKARLSEDRKRLQSELPSLSGNGKQIVAEKSGHHIQLDEPGLVVGAIHQMVKASRTGKKLIRNP